MHYLQTQETVITNPHLHQPLGLAPQQYARLKDQAKAEAVRLRREAIDALFVLLADAARSALAAMRRAVGSNDPHLFFTPMLLLAAALSFGAIVLFASGGPATSLEAQQQKYPKQESAMPKS